MVVMVIKVSVVNVVMTMRMLNKSCRNTIDMRAAVSAAVVVAATTQ